MSSSEESMQKKLIAMAIAIFFLLSAVGYLIYDRSNNQEVIAVQENQLDEAKTLQEDLQNQYEEIMTTLDEQKGENEELNAMVENQKEELSKKKNEISKLIRKGNATKADLSQAKTDIDNMRVQLGGYLSELNTLKEQNKILTNEKVQLIGEKKILQTNIETERTAVANLATEKAVLVGQKENLEKTNENLNKKVSYASVIRVSNVTGAGMKERNSGKVVQKTYAKNVESLQICFNTTVNDITPMGPEEFYVRVINPVGETMAVDELGSGIFTDNKTKQKVRYTQKTAMEYERTEEGACISWEPNIPFSSGIYEIEIYNKGHLAGNGSFQLK